jgi:hypothetical protein
MNTDDAEEYTQALGQIVAGSWRQVALAKRLGVPDALGLTVEEWVQNRLGGYIRMSIPERREAVQELIANGHSNVAVGKILGVDESTVRDDRTSGNPESATKKPNKINDAEDDDSENSDPDEMQAKPKSVRSPPSEDFLTASEADKAIKRIANIVHCATLNPPVGIRACLRGAILRAAPEDIEKIAAAAEFLNQLRSDAL